MHAPPEDHETVECKLCGTLNDKDAENCRRCGMPLGLATRRPLDTVKLNRESDLEDPTTRPFEAPQTDFILGEAPDTRRLSEDEASPAEESSPEPGEPGWLSDFHGVEGFDAPPAPSEPATADADDAESKLPPAEPAPDYDSGDLPGWLSDLAAQPMRSKAAPPPPDILDEPQAPADEAPPAETEAEEADTDDTDWSAAGDRTLLERHRRPGHSEEGRLPPIGSPPREPSPPPVLSADEELPDWLAYLVNADADQAVADTDQAEEPPAEHEEEDYSHEISQEVGNEVADTWLSDLGALSAMPFEKAEEAAKAISTEPVEPPAEAEKASVSEDSTVSEEPEKPEAVAGAIATEAEETAAAEAPQEAAPVAEGAGVAEVSDESEKPEEAEELATAEVAGVPEEVEETEEGAEAKPEPSRPAAAVADNSLDVFGELLEPPDIFTYGEAPPTGQHDTAAELEGAFSVDAQAEEEDEAEPAEEGEAESIAEAELEAVEEPEAEAEEITPEAEAVAEAEAESEVEAEAGAITAEPAQAAGEESEEEPPDDEPEGGGSGGGGSPSSPENVAAIFHHAGGDLTPPQEPGAGLPEEGLNLLEEDVNLPKEGDASLPKEGNTIEPFPWEMFDDLPAIDAPPSPDGLSLGGKPAPVTSGSPGDAPSVAGSVPPIADEPSIDDILPAAEYIPPAPQQEPTAAEPEPIAEQAPPTEQAPTATDAAGLPQEGEATPSTPQEAQSPYAEEDRPWGGDDPSAAEAIAADAAGPPQEGDSPGLPVEDHNLLEEAVKLPKEGADAPPWGWPDPSADVDSDAAEEEEPDSEGLADAEGSAAEGLSARIQELRYEALAGAPPQGVPTNRELFGALQGAAGLPQEGHNLLEEAVKLPEEGGDRTLEFSERQQKRIERLRWLLNEERRPVPLTRTRRAEVRVVGTIRRLVALIMILMIALPLVLGPLGLPGFATPTPGPEVGAAIDALDALGSQGRVLAVFEYGPDTAAELDPLAGALLERLAVEPDIAVDAISTLPTGPAMAEAAFSAAPIEKRLDDPEARWTNLGYLPGGATGVSALALGASPGVPSALSADRNGTPTGLDGTRLLAGPYDAIIVIAARPEDVQMWVEQAGQPTGLPIIAALSARAAPLAQPYRSSGQLVALLTGIPDAAGLHAAAGGSPNRAVLALRDSQIAGSLAAALLILLGALTYGLFMPRTTRRPTP